MKEATSGLAPVSIHMPLSKEMRRLFEVSFGRISFAVCEATSIRLRGTTYCQDRKSVV